MDSYALQNRQRRIKIKTLDHFLQAAEIIVFSKLFCWHGSIFVVIYPNNLI